MGYRFPLDPDCPGYAKIVDALMDDPMTEAMGAPVDDIMEDFGRRHRNRCQRCRDYGAANVEADC